MITLKGFDKVSLDDRVEIPNIAELLHFPILQHCDMEFALNHSCVGLRELLQAVPLRNDRKYITVHTQLQYLTPNAVSVPRATWHFDTIKWNDENACRTHLLLSNCSALTEFSCHDIEIDGYDYSTPRYQELESHINERSSMFSPIMMPSDRFVSFIGLTPHRCTRPKQREFRYMLRVIESDYLSPKDGGEFLYSQVFIEPLTSEPDGSAASMSGKSEARRSIEQEYQAGSSEIHRVIIYNN